YHRKLGVQRGWHAQRDHRPGRPVQQARDGAGGPAAVAGGGGAAVAVRDHDHGQLLSVTRMTFLTPDQTSSIAHTLTSTRPCPRTCSRTTLSVRSVGTPEARFGQATHSAPACVVFGCSTGQRRRRVARSGQKHTITSYGRAPARRCT